MIANTLHHIIKEEPVKLVSSEVLPVQAIPVQDSQAAAPDILNFSQMSKDDSKDSFQI